MKKTFAILATVTVAASTLVGCAATEESRTVAVASPPPLPAPTPARAR